MRGNNPTEFDRALGAAPAVLGLIREVQQAITTGGVSEQQALANVAHIAAPVQADDGWGSPPQQTAPAGFSNVAQPLTQMPVQPAGPVLPQGLAKYNQLVPGLPVQPCQQCGQSAYPVSFESKAGKTFKKYKCGVDDKNHENPWI